MLKLEDAKPCPFCGRQPNGLELDSMGLPEHMWSWLTCRCDAAGPTAKGMYQSDHAIYMHNAVAAWNYRVEPGEMVYFPGEDDIIL